MRIEMIQHNANHCGFGIAFVYQSLPGVGKVELRTLLGYLNVPPARLRFHKEQEVARAVAFIFVIIALRSPRLGRQWLPGLLDELFAVSPCGNGGTLPPYLWPRW